MTQLPTTTGPVHRVPCPHCGKPQDMRELAAQNLLDTGNDVVCEDCGRVYIITGIAQIMLITVRPSNRPARRQLPDAQPATTVGPRQMQRLLRR